MSEWLEAIGTRARRFRTVMLSRLVEVFKDVIISQLLVMSAQESVLFANVSGASAVLG